MRFVSFNVNGIRARLHQVDAIIKNLRPDIIGLQETKVHDSLFPIDKISHYGYHMYFCGRKKYHGVALLSFNKPISVRYELDANFNSTIQRYRTIVSSFTTSKGLLTVINGYFPYGESRDHLKKFQEKKEFYCELQNYLKKYNDHKSLLLVMGDMNICPSDMDVGIEKVNYRRWIRFGKCSFLPEERQWIQKLLSLGLVDVYRQLNPYDNKYSWFDYRLKSFSKNRGLRIDLLLASEVLSQYVQSAEIDYTIRSMERPSDHAPVWADFDLKFL